MQGPTDKDLDQQMINVWRFFHNFNTDEVTTLL